jgi:hypothetical protein
MQIPFRLRLQVTGYDPDARAIGGGRGAIMKPSYTIAPLMLSQHQGRGGVSLLILYKLSYKEAPPDQRP